MGTENKSCAPRLRFPGFTGEWKEQPLANFLFEHKTKSDGICAVHSVSVSQGVVDQVKYLGRSFAAADTSKYNLAKPGDIIYTKSPTGAFPYGIIKQNKNPYNVIVSPLYAVYTPVTPYLGYILDSYFESPANTNNYLSSLVQKGAKNTINITNDTFVSKVVCLPTDPEEQKKIAECLAEMDKLIAAQGENVDALKEKKTGLMQQLFPQNGETAPRLRFPGFSGEWDEKKLGEVCDVIMGQSPSSSAYNTDGIGLPLIQGNSDIKERKSFVRIYTSQITKTCEENEVLMSVRAPVGSISRASSKACIGRGVCALRNASMFVYHYLIYIEPSWERLAGGSTFTCINSDEIDKRIILLPPTLAEQKKIAECLSALDDQIAAESAKLEALKEHKKGLMQQLFPQLAK